MKRIILFMLLLNILASLSFAQGEGVMPDFTLQRSLPLIGAGQIGTAKANNDPIGYYLNPAILGYSSQNNHASLFFTTDNVNWFPNAPTYFDMDIRTTGFNIGINFKKYNLPISVGIGFMNYKFSFSNNSYNTFCNYSLGISLDYYLLFAVGISVKPYKSVYTDSYLLSIGETAEFEAEGTAWDYGAMIIAPISKLFFDKTVWRISNTTEIKPTADITLGYSLTNVGDEFFYSDPNQSDPLSRTGRLGYTLEFGFNTFINNNKLKLFDYSFTAEAEDLLINHDENYRFTDYQSLLGDIDIGTNLFQLKATDKVVLHKGHTFNFFETVTIVTGSFAGRGYRDVENTSGYGVSSEGMLKLYSWLAQNKTVNYIAKHFVIEYYDVTIFKESSSATYMQGFSLHIKNIEL